MKKIFAILLAVVVALSMGVTSFAAVEAAPTDIVTVGIVLDEISAPKEAGKVETETDGPVTIETQYRDAEFTVTITNGTKKHIMAEDFIDFSIKAIATNREEEFGIMKQEWEKDPTADSISDSINAGKNWTHGYNMRIKTNEYLWFVVSLKGQTKVIKNVKGDATFEFVVTPETTTTTTIPTTVTPTEPSVETTTEAPTTVTTTLPNESETGGVDDELYPDVGDGNGYFDNTTTTKKPSNVESDIPNTGSGTAGMIAFGVLGVAALAALKMRKKKIDD